MESPLPEEVARLYEENDEIEKIYGLLRSGRQMREILGAASQEVPPAPTEPSVESVAEVSQSIGRGPISDCWTDTDQPAAADPSDACIPQASRLGRRSVAVLSVMALIVVTAVAFFEHWHRAARALAPLREPQVVVAPASSPAVDPAPAVAPDSSVAVSEPPLIATVAAASPQPKPVTVGDAPDPAAQPEVARAVAKDVPALLGRGDELLAAGDAASARLFYERAADAGDASAALRLGETYDPAFLTRIGLTGVSGDIAVARRWYRRASELGATEAEVLLKNTEN